MPHEPTRTASRKPRVAFTWWWVVGAVIAAAAVWGFHSQDHPKRAPAERNTVELSHTPPG